MEIVVELYVCENCQHVEFEHPGVCPECGCLVKCVDFVPRESAQQCVQSDLRQRDESEFPVYYDAQGNEHQEF